MRGMFLDEWEYEIWYGGPNRPWERKISRPDDLRFGESMYPLDNMRYTVETPGTEHHAFLMGAWLAYELTRELER